MLIIIYLIMLADYALTKIGMQIGMVTEGNGLMQWLVNLPIGYGIVIRALMCFMLLIPIHLVKRNNKRLYIAAVSIALTANIIVLAMHCVWIAMIL
jgi:hypothetical protein